MKTMRTLIVALLLMLSMSVAVAEDGFTVTMPNDLSTVKPGDFVTFGTYEQDGNLNNGSEPLEWIVLDVVDGRAMLITNYCIDARAYHVDFIPMTWEHCTLRKWLNSEFIDIAFSAEEQTVIPTVTIQNPGNQFYGTPGGNATDDRVFLLSHDEAMEFFKEDSLRQGIPTPYAVERGAYYEEELNRTWWWLRTAGVRSIDACGVRVNGRISGYGSRDVYRPSGALRPVIWVEMGK